MLINLFLSAGFDVLLKYGLSKHVCLMGLLMRFCKLTLIFMIDDDE